MNQPTYGEVLFIIKDNSHRCIAELSRICGISRYMLGQIIDVENITLPNHQGKRCK